MKSKICTTIEQSRKLLELGVDVNTADMCYPYDKHLDKMYGDIPYVMGYKRFNESTDIPAWSLSALLELMPKIETNLAIYYPNLYKTSYGTLVCGCIDEDSRLPLVLFTSDTYIDAVFDTVVWLKENGKI